MTFGGLLTLGKRETPTFSLRNFFTVVHINTLFMFRSFARFPLNFSFASAVFNKATTPPCNFQSIF